MPIRTEFNRLRKLPDMWNRRFRTFFMVLSDLTENKANHFRGAFGTGLANTTKSAQETTEDFLT